MKFIGTINHSQFWGQQCMPKHLAEHLFGEIAKCPFCGSDHVGLWCSPTPHMTCGNCGADGPSVLASEYSDGDLRQREAVRRWNGRV